MKSPTNSPRADPLQAWSAAAMPFVVSELLGLSADGFAKRLHIRRPLLPDGTDTLALHRMNIGNPGYHYNSHGTRAARPRPSFPTMATSRFSLMTSLIPLANKLPL